MITIEVVNDPYATICRANMVILNCPPYLQRILLTVNNDGC
jgi:hypothetical protein